MQITGQKPEMLREQAEWWVALAETWLTHSLSLPNDVQGIRDGIGALAAAGIAVNINLQRIADALEVREGDARQVTRQAFLVREQRAKPGLPLVRTKAGYTIGYEVKVSRADFRADARKLRTKFLTERSYSWRLPAAFYYVMPVGLVEPSEVPEFAGLLYVTERCSVEEWRRARRLHGEKINDWQRRQLERALTERFWRQRLKGNPPSL